MNLNQIEKTYEYADKVYNNLMDKQEAVNLLFNDFPEIKDTTHRINIDDYKLMLEGNLYKWALNVEMTVYFLNKIKEKYGVKALEKALTAVRKNICFQYQCNEAKSNRMREECKKIADANGILINFDDNIFAGIELNVKNKESTDIDSCWLVGATWGSVDKTNEFLKEGIWQNGYADKYLEKVNSIQEGDKIAIKSAYTQKSGLPFNLNGAYAAVMNITVTGTVTKNLNDGRTVEVKWDKPFDIPKKWYFFTFRQTIAEIKRQSDDWKFGALLDFIFKDSLQDYNKFLNDPYWSDKYSTDSNMDSQKDENEIKKNPYTKQNFLNEIFMTETDYDKLVALLKYKKNIILQGAPGVGKTFTAKRLAYSLIGTEDDSRIEMVQFHQNYSYEDFVMGYRPTETGFELRNGVFYDFCEKARSDIENDYYFIIDEINRGNLSAVFGELLMLVEGDYRDKPVRLVYKKDKWFSLPHNVYIIGMMNTADRSIAMIDYALRRRFSFFTMKPGFDSEGFVNLQNKVNHLAFNTVINEIKILNNEIAEDDSLGEGFCIGHSYFVYDEKNPPVCGIEMWLKNVIEYDICPMLDEYWFDDKQKADSWQKRLTGIFSK